MGVVRDVVVVREVVREVGLVDQSHNFLRVF